jgi:hypothetical protein
MRPLASNDCQVRWEQMLLVRLLVLLNGEHRVDVFLRDVFLRIAIFLAKNDTNGVM